MGTLAIGRKQQRRALAFIRPLQTPLVTARAGGSAPKRGPADSTTYVSFGAFSFLGLWSFTVERGESASIPESGERAS